MKTSVLYGTPARLLFALLVLLLVAGLPQEAAAQKVVPAPEARLSPTAITATKLGDGTYVKVVYSAPRRRDPETGEPRQIFGGLVPYGQVWRLGANEATEITTTGDISLAGNKIPAGTYALFAVPGEDKWTIVVNKDLGQWGAYSYNEKQDLLRFDVPASRSEDTYEAFTMAFDENGQHLNIMWDQTKVAIPVASL